MGRPRLRIGEWGEVQCKQLPDGRCEARGRIRNRDGTYSEVRRVRKTKTAARGAVKEKLEKLAEEIRGGNVNGDTRLRTIALEWWLPELEREANLDGRSHDTVRLYRGNLNNHVLPALGALTMDEAGPQFDELVKRKHDTVGYSTARTTRSVLRGLNRYAIRKQCTSTNWAATLSRLVEGNRTEIRALTLQERKDLIAGLREVAKAHATDAMGRSLGTRAKVWADLPDLVEAMLCTGVRLGELLALVGPSFGRNAEGNPVVYVAARIVREHGQLVRKAYRKGSKNDLVLQVPEWSVPMWNRRRLAAGTGPMFASIAGGWVHPTNMGHRIREAFNEAGFDWVKSHHFRKTVASVLDEAGLPTRAIADQLGHANESTARKHYVAPKAGNLAAVAALEGMVESS